MTIKETRIIPRSHYRFLDLSELWQFRELFYIFSWRDIKVRYRQTVVGVVWIIIQPIVSTFIFTVLFGNLAKIPSSGLPYTVFVLCGLVYWNFFSSAITESTDSIVANQSLVKKVYFPKMILVFSSILTRCIDFAITLILLLLFSVVAGSPPHWQALFLIPVALLLAICTACGVGLLFAAINVTYRDVRYVTPFAVQLMFYLTPVIYPLAIVSETHRYLFALNPLSVVIEIVRFAFGSTMSIQAPHILIATTVSLGSLVVGLWYFRRVQDAFSDIV